MSNSANNRYQAEHDSVRHDERAAQGRQGRQASFGGTTHLYGLLNSPLRRSVGASPPSRTIFVPGITVLSAITLLVALCGCTPPTKAPDTVQIKRGVDRSSAVQAESDKRVKEYEALTEQKR